MARSVENSNKGVSLESLERKLNAARNVSDRDPHIPQHRGAIGRMSHRAHEVLLDQVDVFNYLNENNQMGKVTTVFEGKHRFGAEVFVDKRKKQFRNKRRR